MKILISGPPESGKKDVINHLRSHKWFIREKYKFISDNINDNDEKFESFNQYLIFNDQIRKIFDSTQKSVFCGSIYDNFAHTIKLSMNGKVSSEYIESYVGKVPKFLKYFDIIFVLSNKKSEMNEYYEKVKFLLTDSKNIVFLDDAPLKSTCNTITDMILTLDEKNKIKILT